MTRILQNSIACLLCMLACNCIHAQFKNKAALPPVSKTGFYAIDVTPELSSYVKTDFSDVRVVDEEGKQAEYIIRHVGGKSITDSSTYKPLQIIEKKQADSGRTIIVIGNDKKEKLNSMALLIANASVSRTVDISGSDDGKQWYSIAENVSLERKYITDTDKYAETIFFPLVSYHYIRLVIYNGKNNPLNILEAGQLIINEYHSAVTSVQNPLFYFEQKDSTDGYSYLRAHDTRGFQIDEITLHVEGPRFFKRQADIIIPYGEEANFTLSSNTSFSLDMPVFKAKDWLVKIYNGDSPPLKVKDIFTSQEAKRIIVWLDSGKTYHLEMNDANAVAPQYDLQNFKDSIPKNITPIKYSTVEPIAATVVRLDKSFFKQSWLWVVIIGVLAMLVFFTWQLVKEVGKRK